MSWKNEVKTNNDINFATNALRFKTRKEAEAYGADLYSRWTSVTEYRAKRCNDPVNYTFKDGRLESVVAITLIRVEGESHECDQPVTVASWEEADKLLYRWSESAPKDGSYHKCDLVLQRGNDKPLKGQYCLHHWSDQKPNARATALYASAI